MLMLALRESNRFRRVGFALSLEARERKRNNCVYSVIWLAVVVDDVIPQEKTAEVCKQQQQSGYCRYVSHIIGRTKRPTDCFVLELYSLKLLGSDLQKIAQIVTQ
jgi:hypothetical protein